MGRVSADDIGGSGALGQYQRHEGGIQQHLQVRDLYRDGPPCHQLVGQAGEADGGGHRTHGSMHRGRGPASISAEASSLAALARQSWNVAI